MVDIGTMAAAVSGLNTAREMAQALIGIRDASVLNQKVIELQSVILAAQSNALTAQSDQFTLLERIRQLEAQMANLEAWNAEQQKYELTKLDSGGLAYRRKEDAQPPEPSHYICADCYQNRHKSILQTIERVPGRAEVLICQQCGWELYVQGHWQPEHGATKSASRKRR